MAITFTNFFGGAFFGGGFFGAGTESDTHDGGHWKRRKDAKYGDQVIDRSNADQQARRVAIDEAISTKFPKPVEMPEPSPVAAKPATRVPISQSKGIVPTEPDAIDLLMKKQMEDDEKFVVFIATQLHN